MSRSAVGGVVVVGPVVVAWAASTRVRLRLGESTVADASAGVSAGPSAGVVIVGAELL